MTAPLLDRETAGEARIAKRLSTEPLLWLTTVSADSRPHSVPVWFHWSDPVITIFSQAGTAKLERLRLNTAVCVSLDSAGQGTDIVTGEGDATLVDRGTANPALPAFERKYRTMLGAQTLDNWLETFSQPILITLSAIIAWTRSSEGLEYHSIRHRRP